MEQLPVTHFFNSFLAGPANAVLNAVHHPAENPAAPISNWMAMEILVVLILIALFLFVRARLSVESPGGTQHMMELLHEFITDQSQSIIGHHSEGYTPFLASLFIFILFANLLGLIPAFESPTANASVPLGLAIIAWVYYHYQGLRKQGVIHYAAHFAGPVWWLAPLMLPIEIISHLARAMSLTIRLYANIFAGDLVTLVFFSLVPIGVPVIFLGLHLGVSFLQAYIFVLLATIYLSGAVAEEH
jgi:F-type H+-transporting ATPase subunit a